MRWMGHSDISTTMRHYAQAPDELQEKAAKLLGELLFPSKPEPGAWPRGQTRARDHVDIRGRIFGG